MVSEYLEKLRLFNRNVHLYMITAVLIGFTVFGGIYPVLLNLYLLRLGFGPEFIGMVNAGLSLAGVVFSLPAGALGRRFTIRRMMVVGLSVAVLGFGLLPLADFIPKSWQGGWILVSYIIGSLGISIYLVNANPFLMGATTSEERGHAFSLQAALWPLAGFAGSLVGGLLPGLFAAMVGVSLDDPRPYQFPLLLAAVALIPAVIAMYATGDQNAKHTVENVAETQTAPYGLIALMSLVVLLQVAGEGAARTFFNVYLDAKLNMLTSQIGVLSAIGQLLAVPAALAAPLLMKRWGKGRTFFTISLAMALSLLPIAWIPHWGAASLGFICMMALASIARPVIQVYQQEVVKSAWQSTMSGATTMTAGLSFGMMAFGGGYLITVFGYPSLFLTGAGLTAVGAVLFGVYLRGHRGELDSDSTSVVDSDA